MQHRFWLFIILVILQAGCATKVPVNAPSGPEVRLVPGEQMRLDLASVQVREYRGDRVRLTARVANDNDYPNGKLPDAFRRWWHFELAGIDPTEETKLEVELTNVGYRDSITPVVRFGEHGDYQRLAQTPETKNGTVKFSVLVPAGETSVRLAKWYPYTLREYHEILDQLRAHPLVEEQQIGNSVQGRPILMHTITDSAVPLSGKQRVWIHSAVHPAENTAYQVHQGLLRWLLSSDQDARELLRHTVFNVVLMANPDGQALGNYRTNANGVNLEMQFTAPYQSTEPEVQALTQKIEEYMGSAEAPGSNPIRLLLNIHSAHGGNGPFHFVHTGNYFVNGTGVTPAVRAEEKRWVSAYRKRSAFVNVGKDESSSFSRGRAFVEAMMNDRYSATWLTPPTMAITLEGTYERGPVEDVPNTPQDFRQSGKEMGYAIADFLGVSLPSEQ
ncbi:MAG: M14 family zinc carboxypeptidase [Sumerlaeia bacterium]